MAAVKEIMRAIERLRLDRPGRLIRAALDGELDATHPQGIVLAALRELAATYRDEAELWSKSGAKGWKGSEAENYLLAQAVDSVAAQLDNAGGGAALSVSVPQTEPATTHERLDDLVSAAVAEGRGMLKPLAQMDVADDGPDVAAYLKGEIDTLPGLAEALVPGSVVSPPETDNPFLVGEHGPELIDAGTRAKLDSLRDVSIRVTIDATDATMPKTWESESMSSNGHLLPGMAKTLAPTLGQPGDNSGGGYSHDYVPPGGRKLTFADLLTPVPAASLPPHLSHSQGTTITDCAAKYRMQRVEQLPQIPQWANIGGTAFHAAVEAIERMIIDGAARGLSLALASDFDVDLGWKHHFDATIAAVAASTTVPQSVWRASRKGAEGEAWWWVNGPKFLRAYLDARPDEPTWETATGEPAIELDRTVDVPTPYGPIPFNAKIDRITVAPDGTLTIRDYKTSYERPTDTTQLGEYHWVLRVFAGGMAPTRVLGSYFDARRGTWTEPVDLLAAHPFEAFQYRVTTAHAQKRALTTGPTPARPSSFCGGCSVRYACPIMASKS